MSFACKRCGHEFNTKYHLRRHLERQNVCKVVHENIPVSVLLIELEEPDTSKTHACKKCGKTYTTSNNMYRHQSKCNAVQRKEQELKEEIMDLKRQVATMQEMLPNNLASTSSMIINNNTYNIGQQNINITLNNFGNETYEHISDDFLRRCINNEVNGVKSLIEKIHFSEEAPANKNIRLKSLKRNLVEVTDNQKWSVKDADDAMETMISKGGRLLHRYYHNSDIYQREIDELENRIQTFLLTIVDKNSKQYYALRRRILALIIEHTDDDEQS